jgi:hypothetical protein
MGIVKLLSKKRKEILETAASHGAHNVRVFGSVARNEAGPRSDVDFLVELDKGRSLFDHAALMLDLEKLLGRRVDVVTPAALRRRTRARILKEAIAI